VTCGCDGQRSRSRDGPILSVSSIISIIVAFTGRVLWFSAIVVIEKIPVTSLWKIHTACIYCARLLYCGVPVRPSKLTMLNSVWRQSQYRVEVFSTWVLNLYDVKLGFWRQKGTFQIAPAKTYCRRWQIDDNLVHTAPQIRPRLLALYKFFIDIDIYIDTVCEWA